MIGSTEYNQLSFLESNERRHLRNYQSGNGSDSDVQVVIQRIAEPVSGTGEAAKGSDVISRVRFVVNKIREGRIVSLPTKVGILKAE